MKKTNVNKSKIMLIIQTVIMYLIHILLLVEAVLTGLGIELSGEALEVVSYFFVILLALMILVFFISLVFACMHLVRDEESPLKTAMIVKLCLIPWFIVNLIICVLLLAPDELIQGLQEIPAMITYPIGFITLEASVTYILMFMSGMSSIVYCVRYIIIHKIKPSALIITALIFHLCFCLDVVGAVMLEKGFKKLEAEQKWLLEQKQSEEGLQPEIEQEQPVQENDRTQ